MSVLLTLLLVNYIYTATWQNISSYLLSLQCHSCFSNYVLKIRAVRYRNPTDEDHNGESCDILFYTECDVYLQFCIRNVNLSPSNADNCWDTITTSPSFESTDLTFPTTGSLYPGANVNNPVTFTGSSAWPVSLANCKVIGNFQFDELASMCIVYTDMGSITF